MKRLWLIVLTLTAVILGIITWVKLRPVEPEVSELYQRCKDIPSVRVGFIKDFPLNDSVTCDVTTIEALTDEGWERLIEELGLEKWVRTQEEADAIALEMGIKDEEAINNTLLFSKTARNHPEIIGPQVPDYDSDSCDCMIGSIHLRWFASFHVASNKVQNAVWDNYMFVQIGSIEPPELPTEP